MIFCWCCQKATQATAKFHTPFFILYHPEERMLSPTCMAITRNGFQFEGKQEVVEHCKNGCSTTTKRKPFKVHSQITEIDSRRTTTAVKTLLLFFLLIPHLQNFRCN
jgi:hypothetical protein